jgi:hypothetical protein
MIGKRLWALAERFVVANERIALAQEESVLISRQSVDIARRTADALESRVGNDLPQVDLTGITEAVNGLRELIASVMGSLAAERASLTSRTDQEVGK